MEINTDIWFNWSMFAFFYQTLVERANEVAKTEDEAYKADLKNKYPERTARQIQEYYESVLNAQWEGLSMIYATVEDKAAAVGVPMPFTFEELSEFIEKGGIWK